MKRELTSAAAALDVLLGARRRDVGQADRLDDGELLLRASRRTAGPADTRAAAAASRGVAHAFASHASGPADALQPQTQTQGVARTSLVQTSAAR